MINIKLNNHHTSVMLTVDMVNLYVQLNLLVYRIIYYNIMCIPLYYAYANLPTTICIQRYLIQYIKLNYTTIIQ